MDILKKLDKDVILAAARVTRAEKDRHRAAANYEAAMRAVEAAHAAWLAAKAEAAQARVDRGVIHGIQHVRGGTMAVVCGASAGPMTGMRDEVTCNLCKRLMGGSKMRLTGDS